MLETLHIRNLATVSVLDIELASGLNVLTGETGAGKSIILGAVQVLLGERAEKTIIRKGESACEITASLYLGEAPEPLVRQVADTLENSGLPACEEDQLLLRRVVTRNGSRAYVNATPVTLDIMRQLGNLLVDIHGPNDHQSLLHPRCQRDLLDAFGSLAEARHACSACYEELTGTRESLDNLRNEHLSPAECEMLRYQLNEIESEDLRPDEEEALNERHRTASHARSLLEIAGRCREGLSEGEGSICDQLSDYVRMMQEVEQMAPAPGRSFVQQTESVVETLQELSNDLTDLAESLELDQEELTRLEDRIETIHKLKRKYARSIDDILSEADRIRDRLTTLDSREQRIAELETQQRQAETNLYEHCSTLTASRREAAGRLGRAIAGKLKHLGFEQGAFDISVTEAAPGPAGADSIEFSFAP
ncbi:MAG: AAA family ATPase, partial [Candidatus Pacebacteria bacterium]|nr:AAA family ATPase [Candidatus Paceibacterota bacterium]